MPIYVTTITTPANTSKTLPKEVYFEIKGEFLSEVQIVIPPGHAGLTGIAVFYGIHQLFPLPRGEWLSGEDERISFPERWEIPFAKASLRILTYNEDDTYGHSFIIRFITVEHKEELIEERLKRTNELLEEIVSLLHAVIGIPASPPVMGIEELIGKEIVV